MKKTKRLLMTCLTLLFTLCVSANLVGCLDGDAISDAFNLTKEEMTPQELGAPEGLYFYKGNTRSLTDGSQKRNHFD